MAISFIGSAVASASPNASMAVTFPGGMAVDDLIIAAYAVGDTANNGIASQADPPWIRVPGAAATLYSNDLNDTNLDLYYRFHDGSQTSATTVGAGGTNASNAVVIMVFRGVDLTTPFDTNANSATGINTSNADPPSHDHSGAAGTWTVIAASTGHTGTATATFTFPTGYTTDAAQRAHNDTIDVLVGMGYKTSPSDPENPGVLTAANIGTAADNAWAAYTMSLKPAGAAPQNVNPGLISQLASIFAPTLNLGGINVSPGLQSQLASQFNPTITSVLNLTPDLISQPVSVFAPTLTPGGINISPGLISQLALVFDPTISQGEMVTPGFIQQLAGVFAPTITSNLEVTPAQISQPASVFGPTVSFGGTDVSPGLIQRLAVLFQPTLDPPQGGEPGAEGNFVRLRRRRRMG